MTINLKKLLTQIYDLAFTETKEYHHDDIKTMKLEFYVFVYKVI